MTKGVPQTVQAIIENAQPFKHMPEDAEHHPLAILHSLSNLDKHRVLATVIGAVTHEGVGIPEGIDLAWEEPASNKRLGHGRAHISSFVIRGEAEVENVKVESMFSYDVRIEGRPVGTLKWIGNMVYRTFYEIDRGEKAPLFLPTPL